MSFTFFVPFQPKFYIDKTSTELFHVTICVCSIERSTSVAGYSTSISTLLTHHVRPASASRPSFCVRRRIYFSMVSYQKRVQGYLNFGTLWWVTTRQGVSQSPMYAFVHVALSHVLTRSDTGQIGIVSFIVKTTLCIQLSPNSLCHNRRWGHHPPARPLTALWLQTSYATTPTFVYVSQSDFALNGSCTCSSAAGQLLDSGNLRPTKQKVDSQTTFRCLPSLKDYKQRATGHLVSLRLKCLPR